MVRAVRGNKEIEVSTRSFETMFKPQGYVLKNESMGTDEMKDIFETEGMQEDFEESKENIDEVPISDMNKSQLAEYAKKHNIDTSSAKTVSEAKKIIQKVVRERNM